MKNFVNKFLQNAQENTCVRVLFLIKLPITKNILELLLLHELDTDCDIDCDTYSSPGRNGG